MYERKDVPTLNAERYRPKCHVIRPPSKDACGKPAVWAVRFAGKDGGSTTACTDCALYLKQIASAHNSMIGTEKIE
jgi:hypothetical protein